MQLFISLRCRPRSPPGRPYMILVFCRFGGQGTWILRTVHDEGWIFHLSRIGGCKGRAQWDGSHMASGGWYLNHAQWCDTINNRLCVSSWAVLAPAELVSPSEKVAAGPWWLNSEITELCGGKAEEGFPAWNLRGVRGQVAADQGQEGLRIWDERSRRWDRVP